MGAMRETREMLAAKFKRSSRIWMSGSVVCWGGCLCGGPVRDPVTVE